MILDVFFSAKSSSQFGWYVTLLVLAGFAGIGIAGYVFYKYRLRVCVLCETLC